MGAIATDNVEEKVAGEKVMLVGFDDSEHSVYALKSVLSHFFSGGTAATGRNPNYKLVILHSKPAPSSVFGLGVSGGADMFAHIESPLKQIAARAIEVAKELCVANSVTDAVYEVVEGDARIVLCNAVERYHADVLVVGSHGYGSLRRAMLGSVSDYCVHHAHCMVMIVKKPKHN